MYFPHHLLVSFVIVSCCYPTPTVTIGFSEALDIAKVAKDLIIWIAKTWNIIDGHVEFSTIPLPLLDRTEQKLFGRINIINSKLNILTEQIESIGIRT